MIRNKEAHPGRVLNLAFEDLLKKPQETLEKISAFAGIEKTSGLAHPTFQTMGINANSHFAVEKTGIIQGPLEREKVLNDEDKMLVEKRALPVYEQVQKILD
jgi:hypothetical protein